MKDVLLRKLVEKGYFVIGTEIDVDYLDVDFTGAKRRFINTFTVTSMGERRSDKSLIFKILSIRDGMRRTCLLPDLVAIEGMTPERFAENYMIDPDGKDIPVVGARRGRRPQWLLDQEACLVDEDDDLYDEAA